MVAFLLKIAIEVCFLVKTIVFFFNTVYELQQQKSSKQTLHNLSISISNLATWYKKNKKKKKNDKNLNLLLWKIPFNIFPIFTGQWTIDVPHMSLIKDELTRKQSGKQIEQ